MQVVSQYSSLLAPLAVDAVLNVRDLDRPDSVDLRDIKVLRKLGGTVSSIRHCSMVSTWFLTLIAPVIFSC